MPLWTSIALFEGVSDESSTCQYLPASRLKRRCSNTLNILHLQQCVSCCEATVLISLEHFCSQQRCSSTIKTTGVNVTVHDGMLSSAHPAVQRGGPSAASSSGQLLLNLPVHATHLRLKRQRVRQPGSISLPIPRCTRHCALAVAGLHLDLQPHASQILVRKVAM